MSEAELEVFNAFEQALIAAGWPPFTDAEKAEMEARLEDAEWVLS